MSRVSNISELHRGDHIAWDRGMYRHHAIVADINEDTMKLRVVHYTGPKIKHLRGKIKEEWVSAFTTQSSRPKHISLVQKTIAFWKGQQISSKCSSSKLKPDPLYVFHYKNDVYTPDEVIERALSRRGESRYFLPTNNCENFANWCKTDISISLQVVRVYQRIMRLIKAENRPVPIL